MVTLVLVALPLRTLPFGQHRADGSYSLARAHATA